MSNTKLYRLLSVFPFCIFFITALRLPTSTRVVYTTIFELRTEKRENLKIFPFDAKEMLNEKGSYLLSFIAGKCLSNTLDLHADRCLWCLFLLFFFARCGHAELLRLNEIQIGVCRINFIVPHNNSYNITPYTSWPLLHAYKLVVFVSPGEEKKTHLK